MPRKKEYISPQISAICTDDELIGQIEPAKFCSNGTFPGGSATGSCGNGTGAVGINACGSGSNPTL
ncbi:MAG: hypothetical protein JW938_01475 [Candidatus Omnitrophica bacterium]|nr:hypothetical protein [Candidatus Omnitrophota bacterium]